MIRSSGSTSSVLNHAAVFPFVRRTAASVSAGELKHSPLNSFHVAHGGTMVNFAGWSLPIAYKDFPISKSHVHTREKASLFDVSHMLQVEITGHRRIEFLERCLPSDIGTLQSGRAKLSMLLNDEGGIVDDLVVTRMDDKFRLVLNAGCSAKDLIYLNELKQKFNMTDDDVKITPMRDWGLLSLTGPQSMSVLRPILNKIIDLDLMPYMTIQSIREGAPHGPAHVSRGGYTGEDGFEIAVPNSSIEKWADLILNSNSDVRLAGLAARDSLRLEAGYCLYGHEINETTTPLECGMRWIISKRKMNSHSELGSDNEDIFPGASKLLSFYNDPRKVLKTRIGLLGDKVAAREGSSLYLPYDNKFNPPQKIQSSDPNGKFLGMVTSGCVSPILNRAIAMAYVPPQYAEVGSQLGVLIRGKLRDFKIVGLPFVESKVYRVPK